jgi:hypothetical protein
LNKDTFRKGMALLSKTFRGVEIDSKYYWEMLKELDDDRFIKSVFDLIKTTEQIYPGTNLIAMITSNAVADKKLLADEEWAKVLHQVMRVGSYGHPDFDNYITLQAVSSIGWKELCLSDESQLPMYRAHFCKAFNAFQKREEYNASTKNMPQLVNDVLKQLVGDKTSK